MGTQALPHVCSSMMMSIEIMPIFVNKKNHLFLFQNFLVLSPKFLDIPLRQFLYHLRGFLDIFLVFMGGVASPTGMSPENVARIMHENIRSITVVMTE